MFFPNRLDNMDIAARQALDSLLQQVVAWGGSYYLEQSVLQQASTRRTKIGCRAVFTGAGAPPPTEYFYALYDMLLDWSYREIVVPNLDADRERAYEFSEGVMDWYLENRKLSEHDIRVLLGRKLYQRFLKGSERSEFNVEAIAQELHLPVDDVFNQARVLKELGYADLIARGGVWVPDSPPPQPLTRSQRLNRFHLTSKGHQWVAAGYPVETMGLSSSVTVKVDVHVAVTNTIQEAQQSEVDEATKERFELLMRRVEAELKKPEGQGSIQPLKDVLEVATNAKGLLGPAIKFAHENWDKLQHLGGIPF
jgi:hypothetical protein